MNVDGVARATEGMRVGAVDQTAADRPAGLMLSVERLLLSPVKPLTVTPRFSAIAEPSTPVSATGVTVAASGFTVTTSVVVVAVVLKLPSPSFSVAATVSVKLVALAALIVSADKFQV